jgi:hypothetical protein
MTRIGDVLRTPWGSLVVVERVWPGDEILGSARIGLPVEETSAIHADPDRERRQQQERSAYARRAVKGETGC